PRRAIGSGHPGIVLLLRERTNKQFHPRARGAGKGEPDALAGAAGSAVAGSVSDRRAGAGSKGPTRDGARSASPQPPTARGTKVVRTGGQVPESPPGGAHRRRSAASSASPGRRR